MAHSWIFDASLEPLLKRCLDATPPQVEDNKWVRAFGRKRQKIDSHDSNSSKNVNNNHQAVVKEATVQIEERNVDVEPILDIDYFSDPINRFDQLVVDCLKDQQVIIALAQRLSSNAVEKIANHLFNQKIDNLKFLDAFYKLFMPTYLKRDQSWLSLDLLMKSYKIYPVQFKKLLPIVLKDVCITNRLLLDFVQSCNDEDKLSFFNNLTEIDLNTEQFIHNIFLIYSLYKECKKSGLIQHYVSTCLINHSSGCVSDKNYGRLFMAYLQSLNAIGSLNDHIKLEKILEMHRSPFKRPCLSILKEIVNKCN